MKYLTQENADNLDFIKQILLQNGFDKILRIKQIILITRAEYAESEIFATIPNSASPICQYIKSFLLFVITDIAIQIADSNENIFPMIKYVCILSS